MTRPGPVHVVLLRSNENVFPYSRHEVLERNGLGNVS